MSYERYFDAMMARARAEGAQSLKDLADLLAKAKQEVLKVVTAQGTPPSADYQTWWIEYAVHTLMWPDDTFPRGEVPNVINDPWGTASNGNLTSTPNGDQPGPIGSNSTSQATSKPKDGNAPSEAAREKPAGVANATDGIRGINLAPGRSPGLQACPSTYASVATPEPGESSSADWQTVPGRPVKPPPPQPRRMRTFFPTKRDGMPLFSALLMKHGRFNQLNSLLRRDPTLGELHRHFSYRWEPVRGWLPDRDGLNGVIWVEPDSKRGSLNFDQHNNRDRLLNAFQLVYYYTRYLNNLPRGTEPKAIAHFNATQLQAHPGDYPAVRPDVLPEGWPTSAPSAPAHAWQGHQVILGPETQAAQDAVIAIEEKVRALRSQIEKLEKDATHLQAARARLELLLAELKEAEEKRDAANTEESSKLIVPVKSGKPSPHPGPEGKGKST
ncbi:uncharacterized protein PAC_11657 [Phialocephala subalpina]|uniref:Uncharacterized protein n=1 Tax=Phialocephala subalpina TaxID=576137 RepID=A0A1L7X9R1_9HELO|nr:uncharacterized protein PAC_11657 [Phialocephala subalpina]